MLGSWCNDGVPVLDIGDCDLGRFDRALISETRLCAPFCITSTDCEAGRLCCSDCSATIHGMRIEASYLLLGSLIGSLYTVSALDDIGF